MAFSFKFSAAVLAFLFLPLASVPANAQSASDQKLRAIVKEAYQYAYPLVLMDVTMRQTTAVPNATAAKGRAPINQFAYFRTYPAADAKDVVRFNFDTLYSFAWVDLSKGPMILSVPDTGGRYYLVPSLDMWSDIFASVGSRTTGTKAGNFAYVPPGWKGNLPAGAQRIEAPTSMIWVMGRVQTNGPSDYANVHKIQDGLKLTPLDRWGKNYSPPMVHRLERVGFKIGQSFDLAKASADIKQAFERGYKDGKALVLAEGKKAAGIGGKGWIYTTRSGTYGTDYLYRAAIAQCCVGENLPQDAVYPALSSDSQGQPLDGKNNYVLHFDKGKTPPVDAFWSVTAYDIEGYFIPNTMKRQAIGDRDKLVTNADGSLDIYIRSDSPGKDKEANWLPVAKAPFTLLMRLYSPREEFLEGKWAPPPVNKLN